MDYDKILDQAKLVLTLLEENQQDDQKKRDEITEKCKYLIDSAPNIYKMCISGGMDLERLTYMINMVKKVKTNEISDHDASVKVGERLVDEFVKPKINK
jgi:uncharacterized protein YpbB